MMTNKRLDAIRAQLEAGAPGNQAWELQYEHCQCGDHCLHGRYPHSIFGPVNVQVADGDEATREAYGRTVTEICEFTEGAAVLAAAGPGIIRELLKEVERQSKRTRRTKKILAREVREKRVLLSELTDQDDCRFDHHGGCQAHGFLSLEPGETCPHQDAKDWLAANPEASGADA